MFNVDYTQSRILLFGVWEITWQSNIDGLLDAALPPPEKVSNPISSTSTTTSDLQAGHSPFPEICRFVDIVRRLNIHRGWGWVWKMSRASLRSSIDGFPLLSGIPFPAIGGGHFFSKLGFSQRPIYASAPNLKWNCQISIWISCCCCKSTIPSFVQLTLSFGCHCELLNFHSDAQTLYFRHNNCHICTLSDLTVIIMVLPWWQWCWLWSS